MKPEADLRRKGPGEQPTFDLDDEPLEDSEIEMEEVEV